MEAEKIIEIKKENYKKSANELINKYNENVENINLYLERKRLMEDDNLKNKLLGSLGVGYMITFMIVVLLTMTIGIEKIITIVPADIIPLLLLTSISVFSFLAKKIYERTRGLKEIKKFSKSRTYAEKLEEQITYEIEYEKLKNRNKAMEESLDTLKINQEYFEQISSSYDFSIKNEITCIPSIKKEKKLLEDSYKELDVLTTQKHLTSKFCNIRYKSNKILDPIVYGSMGGVGTMMLIFTPLLIIKDYVSYSHILSKLLLVTPVIGGIVTSVCVVKRNKIYTNIFNKLNHILGVNAINDKTKDHTKDIQKYDNQIIDTINKVSTAEIAFQARKREIELFNTENKDKSEVDDKAVEETQSETKLYKETIDNENIIKETKGTTRKKLRKKL